MKAAVIENGHLRAQQVDIPKIKPNEVLIRVHAVGVNRVDLLVTKGNNSHAVDNDRPVPGVEWAGVIVECGAEVPSSLQINQRVVATGSRGFAEYAVADWGRVLPIASDNMSFAEAAILPMALMTMHDAISTNGRLQAGESVLIQAATSGVGLIGLQLAKFLGAGLVIGTSTNAERAARLKDFGADATLNSRDADWAAKARDLTQGKGVDLIIDHISAGVMNQNMQAAAILGRIVNVGRLGGGSGDFDFETHALKRLSYIGVTFRTRSIAEVRMIVDRLRDQVWPAAMQGQFKSPIAHHFSLDDADHAITQMASGAHIGKLVLNC